MVNKISLSIYFIKILSKTIKELYKISSITYNIDYMFWGLILWCWVFYIKETKSVLSILYFVNYVFLASKIL